MATRSRTSPRARGTGRQAVLLCPKEAKERGVSRLRFVLALVAAAMVAVVVTASLANATPSDTRSVAALCKAALQGQLSSEDREWAERCVRVLTEGRKQGKPTPTPTTSTPNPEPTTPTAKPPAPTTPPPPAPVPGGFPNAANTGVPTGTALTAYTGSCVITAPNTVIDAKIANCDLVIRTTGVQISPEQGERDRFHGGRLQLLLLLDRFRGQRLAQRPPSGHRCRCRQFHGAPFGDHRWQPRNLLPPRLRGSRLLGSRHAGRQLLACERDQGESGIEDYP